MKNILITGAGGFIGSHLVELCVERGYKVWALVHYNSRNAWGWLDESPVRDRIKVLAGDVRDLDGLYEAVRHVDTIFHLAALIGIPYSYVSPAAYLQTNVIGTYNILQAARWQGVERVVVTSTSETYGTAQYVPIDERHPLVGQSPYSASKIGADQLALSYHLSYQLPVWIVRPFNTYGPRQSARAIIPTIVTQLLGGQDVLKLGNTGPTRDLTYVKDTARGFLEVAGCPGLLGQVTNIGTHREVTIRELAELIARLMGREVRVETDPQRVRPEGSEVERLWCDNRKLLAATGWQPGVTLEDGLRETIAWLRAHLALYKPDLYNV